MSGALFLFLSLASCALNPATRKRELKLVSLKAERAIGEQVKKDLMEKIGEYPDPKLKAYVTSVGNRLVRVSERKNLLYDFTVLDTGQVNAFAAPGGFIFVTRGLLQELDSEDELALVVGHEIGHVAAWHGINALERQMGTQFLTLLAAVAVSTQPDAGPAAVAMVLQSSNLIGTLYFLGYSRENELEADHLGLKYTWASGHNPESALRFFKRLKTIEEQESGKEKATGWDQFFRSHPPTDERIALSERELRNLPADAVPPVSPNDPYRAMVKGLPQDTATEGASLVAGHYHHKRLKISLEIPPGWNGDMVGGRSLVAFWSQDGAAHGYLRTKKLKSDESASDFLDWVERDLGLERAEPARREIPRQIQYPFGPGYLVQYHMGGSFNRIVYVIRDGRGFFLACSAPEAQYIDYLVAFEGIARSLEFR